MHAERVMILVTLTLSIPWAVTAQSAAEHVARGDSLHDALKPAEALEAYRAAFFLTDSAGTYDTLWRFARAQIDVAKQLVGNEHKNERDSLYAVARQYAETAVRANPHHSEGYFLLSSALGRLSRTRGGSERVRFGREIHAAAAKALELDADHDGALHVLGAWHAEIMRLSGITKFFAKTFLGADFMRRGSRDSAVVYLERAVELAPHYLYHRLELAEIYLDAERLADARHELEQIATLPATSDVMDYEYKEEAARLLEEMHKRSSK